MKLSNNRYANHLLSLCKVLIVLFSVTIYANENSDLKYKIISNENTNNEHLIILLHGMNGDTKMWDDFKKYYPEKTLIIAIEAPFKSGENSYKWYNIDVTQKPFKYNVNQMINTNKRVVGFIKKIALKNKIDKKNIAIAGFSQGAILSLNLALTNPDVVDRVGAFSGMLPDNIKERMSGKINDLSFFITHGSNDKAIDISLAEKTHQFLKGKEMNAELFIDDSGHVITDNQFQNFINWLEFN